MSWLKSQFLKVVEYKDDAKDILVYRYPMEDKEFMKGSKITVRESQNAIFVHKGQVADLFTPGMYTLNTENIPILTSIASWKYLFETPIKADVYFINMRQFTDERWGTINPIIVR
ncbi:MAG: SPFH domain-containing protein, partial [Clostridia bacterium]